MSEKQWTLGHQQHLSDKENRLSTAIKCLKLVKDIISFNSVLDIGCGIGTWLSAARLLGATVVHGIEGEWIANNETVISKELITTADLATQALKFDKQYDLAMSIEVAEHLPESAADRFCYGMTTASNYLLFSAAIPGQGGIGHINEQPLPYWVNKFWQLGYVPLEPIRPYVASDKSILPWIRQNIIMFVNYDVLTRSERLWKFARPIPDFRLHYKT